MDLKVSESWLESHDEVVNASGQKKTVIEIAKRKRNINKEANRKRRIRVWVVLFFTESFLFVWFFLK